MLRKLRLSKKKNGSYLKKRVLTPVAYLLQI